MTDAQLDRCRKRLERFLVDLLEPVGRSERRHWGSVYVRGLLLDGERKSVEPMALRLPDGNEQAMQQFVGQSPWEWQPVWERLARRMVKELEPDAVWVIDDTGFPKQGGHSVGVERQYSGTLGKTAKIAAVRKSYSRGNRERRVRAGAHAVRLVESRSGNSGCVHERPAVFRLAAARS